MKRLVSFVLVLALVLGSFSMAFALTDVKGSDNAEAIQVVNDLGIVTGYTDGSFQPEKAVTRAEFAAMITRALAIPESALAGYTATSFKDTTGYGWAVKYLAFCNDKGIMLGDGNGNAMPGKTINVNEAVTMVLRAVGYTNNSATLVGSWPTNYVTLGQTLGIYNDVAAATTVDRANAAQIIYNALTVTLVQVAADGTTTGLGANMLTAGLACTEDTSATMVDGTEDAVIATKDILGQVGIKVWNSDDELVAVKDVETVFLNVDEIESTYMKDGDTKYYFGTGVDFAALTPAALFTNGAANTTTTTAVEGVVISAVVSGKTITEVKAVIEWSMDDDFIFADGDFDAEDADLAGNTFTTLEDDSIDYDSFVIEGVASVDKIAEDDIVYVYKAGGEITKILVGTETVTGKVTRVEYDSDAATTYYAIGGKEYAATNSQVFAVGDEGTFSLDYFGDIYTWEEESSLVGNYAVVVATKTATAEWTDGSTAYEIKLFTKDGATVTAEIDNAVTPYALSVAPGTIVDFALDKDGVLDEITAAAVATTANGDVATNLIGTAKVAKNVVVFYNNADGDWEIGSMATLAETVSSLAVIVDSNEIVVIKVYDGANTAASEDDTYGIITAYGAKGLDADGEPVNLADVIIGSTVKEDVVYTTSMAVSTTGTSLYKITVDEDGIITNIEATPAAVTAAATVSAIDGNLVTINGGETYEVAADAIVYIYDTTDGWTVGKLSQVKKLTVEFYETDADVAGAEYVVAW